MASPEPTDILTIEVFSVKTETDHIPNVYRALIGHFTTRGLMPGEIEKLFEDVFKILGQGGTFTMAGLNRRLESVGWRNGIVDKISFRLIMYLFEKDESYEVEKAPLH